MKPAEVDAQLEKVKTAAVAFPASAMATLVVTGDDRQTWLNGLITCDLAPLKAGDAAYGLAVKQKGRILSDAIVLLDRDRALVAVPESMVAEVRSTFEHYLIMEDAEIAPEADAFEVTLVQGPRASEVLDAARTAGAAGARLDRTGLGGAVVFAPKAASAAVNAAIAAAIASAGGAMGDDAGWQALCVARAIPRFGADFDGETYPQEAGLEKTAVSFSKGCYLGQEVICMLEMRGQVKRRLVPLALDADELPARGAEIVDASGQRVGEVTSAALVSARPIALGMVKRKLAEAGTQLTVGGAAARVIAPES